MTDLTDDYDLEHGPVITGGSIIGKPRTASLCEEDHYMKCGFCNGWMDCRSLDGVMAHPPYPHVSPFLCREQ